MSDKPGKDKNRTLKDETARLHRLLDELEELVNGGFFISLMGRVVLDEKRLLGIVNEMRKLEFSALPARTGPVKATLPDNADDMVKHAYADAENIKRGADEYAMEVLEELGRHVEKSLSSIQEGKKVLSARLENK